MEENNELNENVVEEKVTDTIQELSETLNEEQQPATEFTINEESCLNLYTAAKWCKFIAILGFIELAFLLIAGLGMMAGAKLLATDAGSTAGIFQGMGIAYIILSIVCFFPISYLLRSAKKIQEAMELEDSEALDTAFLYHRKFWKFLGIFTICSIALSILAIPIILIAAA